MHYRTVHSLARNTYVLALLATGAACSHEAAGNDPGINSAGPFPLSDQVHIDSGLIKGTGGIDPAVTIFKEIPYAAPPIGQLRWKAPQPVIAWNGVREANTFGNNAMQAPPVPHQWWTQEFVARPELASSEDCLTLNLWTDKISTNSRRPVLVFIHGGSYRSGAGSCPVYDGEALACRCRP